ncbi:DUF2799 domain-containing protein [Pseudoalteromonas sp. SSM20]|uniref:DUF2799 domain-containing protein n=1 Tax=Pseudoalteromonas sp. SSM20 TaxID=3139394 RepID=UPI003BABEC24
MRNNLNLGLIIGFMALAGCQSIPTDNEFVCSTQTDWHQLGLTTAQKGKSVRAFDNYKAQCGDALPQNAQDLYLDGFTIGIKEYCTYENGFELAQKDIENPNVCPFEIRAEFDKGYKIGYLDRREKKENADYAERELERRALQNRNGQSSTGQ